MTDAPPRRREILLYGTSANPPTGRQGHMGAIAFCRSLVDEIWILPVYQHIYSSKRQLAPFSHRVALTKLAIEDTLVSTEGATVEVKEYERELFEHHAAQTDDPASLRLGSIDLIRYLNDQVPDANLTMLLGADTYADLRAGKWKEGEELQRRVKLLVMSRKGYDVPQHDDDEANDRVRFIEIPALSDVSSTHVRSLTDAEALEQSTTPNVAAYIVQNKLYGFAA
ncbi:hypothetical protein Poli38472_005533 [Pythium oligandrum]|uniref:Cytidyltransferase-like domain-containing protein n=1 Tax=Pythium oligandrum TaxID=41045 RepID=A0A8K1CHP7_PYTOL|nr:hypothetical protein Poli38472_005533 [Pythium oligandrum]|eukprot:TMW62915.1 hypothetical protein Poli38472_005533 [Pythium oligandrum]